MTAPKPIVIVCAPFSGRVFAVRRYSERDGQLVAHVKEDATDQVIDAVIEHKRFGCTSLGCRCNRLALRK